MDLAANIMFMKRKSIQELNKIPGVGESIANDLLNIGIQKIADLKGRGTCNPAILKSIEPSTFSNQNTIMPLHRCTLAPLHRCTIAPLHRCTVAPLSALPYICQIFNMVIPGSRVIY
jgi:hypothetical protein